jgi:hypothetical protein
MGRPQLVITIECNETDAHLMPSTILNAVREMVAGVPSADVTWHEDEGENDD